MYVIWRNANSQCNCIEIFWVVHKEYRWVWFHLCVDSFKVWKIAGHGFMETLWFRQTGRLAECAKKLKNVQFRETTLFASKAKINFFFENFLTEQGGLQSEEKNNKNLDFSHCSYLFIYCTILPFWAYCVVVVREFI